jgi:hypothetical protein
MNRFIKSLLFITLIGTCSLSAMIQQEQKKCDCLSCKKKRKEDDSCLWFYEWWNSVCCQNTKKVGEVVILAADVFLPFGEAVKIVELLFALTTTAIELLDPVAEACNDPSKKLTTEQVDVLTQEGLQHGVKFGKYVNKDNSINKSFAHVVNEALHTEITREYPQRKIFNVLSSQQLYKKLQTKHMLYNQTIE